MIASIDVAMGGRVAEELYYGNAEISTGKESLKHYLDCMYMFGTFEIN